MASNYTKSQNCRLEKTTTDHRVQLPYQSRFYIVNHTGRCLERSWVSSEKRFHILFGQPIPILYRSHSKEFPSCISMELPLKRVCPNQLGSPNLEEEYLPHSMPIFIFTNKTSILLTILNRAFPPPLIGSLFSPPK